MRLAVVAGATMIAMGGCLSFGDLSGGGSDAGSDLDGASSDGTDQNPDGMSDSSLDLDGGDSGSMGSCAGNAGPSMVRVGSGAGSYCIDSTEVTYSQYEAFVAAVDAGTVVNQPAVCAFNTSFKPTATHADGFNPVTNIDWCDAYAFCAYAGKRLCGKIGGGSLESFNAGNPAFSQWTRACSIAPDGGTENYPYGNTPSATDCNGAERDAGTVVDVGTLASCVGGPSGVFDMSGNVDEWEDCCLDSAGATDCCDTRGGGFHDFETACGIGDVLTSSCAGRTRADVHSDVGFRCCSN